VALTAAIALVSASVVMTNEPHSTRFLAPRAAPARNASLEVKLDGASEAPLLTEVLHDVDVLLHSSGYLGLILIDLEPLSQIESEFGAATYNQTLFQIAAEVVELRHQVMRSGDLICMLRPYGEQLLIFLEGPRQQDMLRGQDLENVTDRIWVGLAPRIAELVRPYGCRETLRLGYSMVLPNSMVQIERLIYRAVDEARVMAHDHARRVATRSKERLRDLLVHQKLHILYQPIIRLEDRGIQGYEALVRGPSGLHMPATLFGLASNAGLVGELARACFELSIAHFDELPAGSLLFANVWPTLVNDPSFRAGLRTRLGSIDPNRVVLEICECEAVHNYELFVESLTELREAGFRLAIDDLGVGHANLDHISHLAPDYMKIDISLIEEIHTSIAKQAIVASMVQIGDAIDATVIAEGVERAAEREALIDLKVPWAQGFHFGVPAAGFDAQPAP